MIRVLDDLTIDKIAAGEVIERPVSVVKELVENSIDANATNICVEIKGGGIDYIRVTDNGSGIPYNEVPTAFLRHATSKIVSSEDLFFLNTLGFRGEALASIAAVSHTEMITKTEDDLMGTKITYNGGALGECIKSGTPEGTTIIVRDLFYNVPARKKFLNSASSEGNKICELMEELVLSNPEISFQLIVNGNVKIQTNGSGNVKDIIFRLFGKETFDALLPVDYEDDFIRMYGFIAKPEVCRPSRSGEIYFINGRYVKNEYITRGIEEGYRNFLMQHKHPFTVLFITLDSFGLDVNVHPAKAEIRITNGDFLVDILNKSIKKTLSDNDLIPKAFIFEEEKKPLERAPEPFEKELIKNSYVIQKGYDKKNSDNSVESSENDKSTEENDKSKEFSIEFDNIFKKEEPVKSNNFMNQLSGIKVKSRYEILEEKLKGNVSESDSEEESKVSSDNKSEEETTSDIQKSKYEDLFSNNSSVFANDKEDVKKDEDKKEEQIKTDEINDDEGTPIVFDDDSLNLIFAKTQKSENNKEDDINKIEETSEESEEINEKSEEKSENTEEEANPEVKTEVETKIEINSEKDSKPDNLPVIEEEKKEEASKIDEPQTDDGKVQFRVKKDGFKTHEEFKSVSKNINPDIFHKVDKFGSSVKKEVKNEEQMLLFQEKTFDKAKINKYEILGQIFDTYWLISVENELLIMDQHAAHEKVLYEKFMKKFKENKVETQTLVVAQVASLGKSEMEVFEKYKDEFTKFGFIINDFGDTDLFIRGVPTDLFGSDAKTLFMDIMSELMSVTSSMHVSTIEDRIATRACKAAIKGNQKVTLDECKTLLDYLFTLENPYTCPHGRPTMIKITKTDLEKMFKRIV